MREMKTIFFKSTEESLVDGSNKFYKYVRSQKDNRSFPSIFHLDGLTADNDCDIANIFADKFGAIYKSLQLLLVWKSVSA